jgi:hypothetical protein
MIIKSNPLILYRELNEVFFRTVKITEISVWTEHRILIIMPVRT